jgi:hypothetical protein
MAKSSLRGAKRRSNPVLLQAAYGLLRFARNDESAVLVPAARTTDFKFQTAACLIDTPSRSRRANPREFCRKRPALKSEGAGNAGRWMRPQPCVRNEKAHKHSHHGHTGNTRHSLRNGFTAYSALSPVTGLVCHRRLRKLPFTDLTPASGRQDHTTSPSAGARPRQKRSPRPPHPAPRS